MYGWTAEEVICCDVREVVRSEYTEEKRAEVFRVLANTGYFRSEAVHHRKDGTPIHIEGNIIALRDAAGKCIQASVLGSADASLSSISLALFACE